MQTAAARQSRRNDTYATSTRTAVHGAYNARDPERRASDFKTRNNFRDQQAYFRPACKHKPSTEPERWLKSSCSTEDAVLLGQWFCLPAGWRRVPTAVHSQANSAKARPSSDISMRTDDMLYI